MEKNSFKRVISEYTKREILVFDIPDENIDKVTVKSFGEEWGSFHNFSNEEIKTIGSEYFDIVTTEMVNSETLLADFGCGSGRFTKYWQGKAKKIIAIDPSDAIYVADKIIGEDSNVELVKTSISNLPYSDNTFDFGMSIGVLHHIPDTQQAMNDCVKKVKIGGYFYVYLYYDLDNRGSLFKSIWLISDILRKFVSSLPQKVKEIVCDIIALMIYMPFIIFTRGLKVLGFSFKYWSKIPLSGYVNKSFFVVRNDSLDRFGTPLEQRFSKKEIEFMMKKSGLKDIIFSEKMPYWHAVGQKI